MSKQGLHYLPDTIATHRVPMEPDIGLSPPSSLLPVGFSLNDQELCILIGLVSVGLFTQSL